MKGKLTYKHVKNGKETVLFEREIPIVDNGVNIMADDIDYAYTVAAAEIEPRYRTLADGSIKDTLTGEVREPTTRYLDEFDR
jgi:hypothetical protein